MLVLTSIVRSAMRDVHSRGVRERQEQQLGQRREEMIRKRGKY